MKTENNPSFARDTLYAVLKLHGWTNKRIDEIFNSETSIILLNTNEEDEIKHNIKFLEKHFINKDIYFNLYNKSREKEILGKQHKEGAIHGKISIEHPKAGRTISEFSMEVAEVLCDKEEIFYRPNSKEVVQIQTIKPNEDEEKSYQGFSLIKPNEFITLVEGYITPYIMLKGRGEDEGWIMKKKSITAELAGTTLASKILYDKLPQIYRIFNIQQPIMYKGELTFPKQGYDPRFKSWLPYGAPIIKNQNMSLDDAKTLISKVMGEFCFRDKQDFSNALAGLLTPFLKGLFPQFNTRCPIFFYIANRERAGKDYLAGITGIVYEGNNLEEPPISTGEKSTNDNDELRKKILSAMKEGRKRLHFQNNKGYINNSVLEGLATSTVWSDRVLGRNETLVFENELDLSLSGNVGIGYTPDLNNRSRKINLFLDIEDANARIFSIPDLHGWVMENREEILSALFSLVKNWITLGLPPGKVPFASFPIWARVCGGIMETAGYESPCNPDQDTLGMSGDLETADMKALFEICYEKYPEKFITKGEIISVLHDSETNVFHNLDFGDRSGMTKFGLKLQKFIGRWLSGILLKVNDINIRSARQNFMFTKGSETQKNLSGFGKDGIDGNELTTPYSNHNIVSDFVTENVAKGYQVTKNSDEFINKTQFIDSLCNFVSIPAGQPYQSVIDFCIVGGMTIQDAEMFINKSKEEGLIYEVRFGYLKALD